MLTRFNKFNLAYVILFLFIATYGFILIVSANFGVIDDHGLLSTIAIGKDMPLFSRSMLNNNLSSLVLIKMFLYSFFLFPPNNF